MNGTYRLEGILYKGSNTFQADSTPVACYSDYAQCLSLLPPPEWSHLLTIAFSQPQLTGGRNNFIWNDDGTYIETKLVPDSCRSQPVLDISQNFFSPSSQPPGPGNNHFCPYQLFTAPFGFRASPSMCSFPMEDGSFPREGAAEAYFSAVEAEETGEPALAETQYLGVIETYPATIYALWSTAGYLRTVKQQGKDPLEAHQILSAVGSNSDNPFFLQETAGMNAIRSLLTAQQYDSAETELNAFLANAVAFEDSAWAILTLEAIPLLEGEGGGGPSIQSVGTARSLRAAAKSYHNRILELFGHKERYTDQEEAIGLVPRSAVVLSHFPNPFNAVAEMRFTLPSAGNVRVDVYNLLGQRVSTIINKELDAGEHRLKWDATDAPSGIYFYKLQFGTTEVTKKMVLIR